MSQVFRKQFTKPVPAGAELVAVRGRQVARWVSRGKTYTAPLNEDGTRIVFESRKWYGTVVGNHVPLCRDKQGAELMLKKRQTDTALGGVGLADPFADHKRTPLANHPTSYADYLTAKGNTLEHVKQSVGRTRAFLIDGCGFKLTSDIDAGRTTEWLNAIRRPSPIADLPPAETFTPAEVWALLGISPAAVRASLKRLKLPTAGHGKTRRYPRCTVEALLTERSRGIGPETVNHYVRAVRRFLRWMVRSKRIGANPLDTLPLLNVSTDIRRG